MATVPPVQPAPVRSQALDAQGKFTPIFVQWFNQVLTTSQVVATNTTNIGALTADIDAIDATLTTQAASILAAAMLAAMIDLPRNWTPELDDLRARAATLETPREDTPALEELRHAAAAAEPFREFTRELDEVRALFTSADVARDFTHELDELRALFAALEVPQPGPTGPEGATGATRSNRTGRPRAQRQREPGSCDSQRSERRIGAARARCRRHSHPEPEHHRHGGQRHRPLDFLDANGFGLGLDDDLRVLRDGCSVHPDRRRGSVSNCNALVLSGAPRLMRSR